MRALVTLAVVLGACGERAPGPRPAGRWHVAGGHLRDPEGRAAVLRGVNLAGAHKRAPYFGFHGPDDLARVRRDYGMNALRFLVSWAAVAPARDRFDEAYLDAVAERMDWAAAAGLVVVLDMHQDVYGEGFPVGNGAPRWTCDEAHYAAFVPRSPWFLSYTDPHVVACYDGFWGSDELQAAYAAAWRRLAERLGDHPAVIGFDVMNEPFWGSAGLAELDRERLGPLYARVVAAVREAAPGWVAFLEPSSARNLGIASQLDPFAFTDVAYAPHSYDAAAEAGNGFDPARREEILANVADLRHEADRLGAALVIGEYGGNADHPGIGAYMDAQYDAAAAALAGTFYWAYDRDDGYGLERPDGAGKPALLDAVVRPYPARVGGDPVSFGFDEATRAFSLAYRARGEAPTELVLPARAYAGGIDLDCTGCARHELRGDVLVVHAGAGDVALRVTPR